jgi:hypothetical protein
LRDAVTLIILVGCTLLACSGSYAADQAADPDENNWWTLGVNGEHQIRLYFFWTRTCPHCQQARPDIEAISLEFPWVELQSRELAGGNGNGRLYAQLAAEIGARPLSVPAFLFCGRLLTGYDNRTGMGAELRRQLEECRMVLARGKSPFDSAIASTRDTAAHLPGLGSVDLSEWSLPLVAMTLGALDSFNPCAFFVLLFLLSLLVNARSRARMLLIGGLFVCVSGIVYFLFMAAWLNLFLVIGQLQWITLCAGLLALIIGVLNVKDFFFLHAGPTLSLPQSAKPGLFRRMRALVAADSLPSMITGTLVLAVFANAYELLCTAGFPMVFTRVLTLENLPLAQYYAYIALYCGVYVLPLLSIVGVFVWTLGRHKLSEHEGRMLKLMSGLMMGGLGILLLVRPELLNNITTTIALLSVVIATTYILHRFTRKD